MLLSLSLIFFLSFSFFLSLLFFFLFFLFSLSLSLPLSSFSLSLSVSLLFSFFLSLSLSRKVSFYLSIQILKPFSSSSSALFEQPSVSTHCVHEDMPFSFVRGLQLQSSGSLSSCNNKSCREAPVRFGYGLGVERFERFRFSVPAVPLQKGFVCASVQFHRKGRFRFRFRFLEDGSGGSGSVFGFGKNGSDGSGFRFRFGSWATLKWSQETISGEGGVKSSVLNSFVQIQDKDDLLIPR